MKKVGIDHQTRNRIFRSLKRLEAANLPDALDRHGVDLPTIRRVMTELNQSRQIDPLHAPVKALRGDKKALKTLDILGLQRPDKAWLAQMNKFLALVEPGKPRAADLVKRVEAAKQELRILRKQRKTAVGALGELKGVCEVVCYLQSVNRPVNRRTAFAQFLKSKELCRGNFSQATVEAAFDLLMRHGAGESGAMKAFQKAHDEAVALEQKLSERIADLESLTDPSHVGKAVDVIARMKPSKARDELELVTEALVEARKKLQKALDEILNSNLSKARAKRQVDVAARSFAKAFTVAVSILGGKTGLRLAEAFSHLVLENTFNFAGHGGKFDRYRGKSTVHGNFNRASFRNAVVTSTEGGSFRKADFSGATLGTLRGDFSGAKFNGTILKSGMSVVLSGRFDEVNFSNLRIESPIDILSSSFRGARIRPEMVCPIIDAVAPRETIGLRGKGANLVREAQEVAERAIADVRQVLERIGSRAHGLSFTLHGLVKRLEDMSPTRALSTMNRILLNFSTREGTSAGQMGRKEQLEKLGEILPLETLTAKLDAAFDKMMAIKDQAPGTTVMDVVRNELQQGTAAVSRNYLIVDAAGAQPAK